jgi:hypothetical protein
MGPAAASAASAFEPRGRRVAERRESRPWFIPGEIVSDGQGFWRRSPPVREGSELGGAPGGRRSSFGVAHSGSVARSATGGNFNRRDGALALRALATTTLPFAAALWSPSPDPRVGTIW